MLCYIVFLKFLKFEVPLSASDYGSPADTLGCRSEGQRVICTSKPGYLACVFFHQDKENRSFDGRGRFPRLWR